MICTGVASLNGQLMVRGTLLVASPAVPHAGQGKKGTTWACSVVVSFLCWELEPHACACAGLVLGQVGMKMSAVVTWT